MDMYDIGASDLKELWDSDLDPAMQDTLKLTTDSDMQDWFLERGDGRLPGVILNDKLMTDAILATFPIKTEHSYSLTSDGDSMPDSPHSLQNKMDDIEEDCYPVITMPNNNNNNNNNNNTSSINHNNHRLLSLGHNNNNNNNNSSLVNNNNILNHHHHQHHHLINSLQSPTVASSATIATPVTLNPSNLTNNLNSLISSTSNSCSNNNNNNNNSLTLNNNNTLSSSNSNSISNVNQLILNHLNSDSSSTTSSLSDIDIDDCNVKDEPISPNSSCPPSPTSDNYNLSMNLANMANYTQTDLVFEHKNGTMQLSQASQNLLKTHQPHLMLGSPTSQSQSRMMLPKFSVKMETQSSTFGLPPTPPSSLPSDESEGNQSPEHHLSPMSPPAPVASHSRRNSHTPMNGIHSSPTYNNNSSRNFASNNTGGSTRQPIHTPLISSQPKGSTGTLMLTEEEKRTLLAEGYPIPTRLPLTKAEEKSLKKIRRKIKNKISAQESRRKKKEYMDQLERKVEILVTENTDYRKRVDSLEDSNASLLSQLKQLQALINRQNGKKTN